MEWLVLSEGTSQEESPTPRDQCGIYFCVTRDNSDGNCGLRICFLGKGCFLDY